ncbi:hypothetical protein ARSEF4850_000603 [Beauveria asiatica]
MAPTKALSSLAASSLVRDLEDIKYCDFALMCKGATIWAHKVVICPQLSVPAAACSQREESVATHHHRRQPPPAQHELETVGSNSPGIDNRERSSNFWPFHQALGTLNFVAHLDIIDVAKERSIDLLATKAVEYFRTEVMEVPGSLTFLNVVPFVFSMDGTGILLQKACMEATRRLLGPGLAVREKIQQLLGNVFGKVPAFSKGLLGPCLTIAAPSSKKCRFPIQMRTLPEDKLALHAKLARLESKVDCELVAGCLKT